MSKELESDIELPSEEENWDQGYAFHDLDKPYFQVSDEEYANWKRLANLIKFHNHLKYGVPGGLDVDIFDGHYEGIMAALEQQINEHYEKVGLNYPNFQHVVLQ